MVEKPLADAWENKWEPHSKWVQETADAIEKLGNQNSSNSGYILLKEEPGEDGLSAVVLPQSIDWQAYEIIKYLPVLQRFKFEDPKKFIELKHLGDRTIRQALTEELHHQVQIFADKIAKVPTCKLPNLSDQDREVVDGLLAIAEEKAPAYISYMQLYVEDRLDIVLGQDNEQLLAFRKLPPETQIAARKYIVEVYGWQRLYRGLFGN
ncbi:hypothetical protein Verru16b_03185 [Lacunisphaera limnophila]|uniref:Uncharacterized protein n=1 Tax=Lacunisphaera limnophila TaxID=1838286 RepID=A0A1D8AYX5_9BACT|nr:hypothetical protein [Lacunisphaera limnophila]AOS46089.1 hypothetical protein Verru16b_03185 [Lacunisphaera limnophila]